MPDNIALYVLLVLTLGIGYLLGRRERRRNRQNLGMVAEDYFKGLNHLLNERHDLAIDTFVERMAVDNDTVDTHLALGVWCAVVARWIGPSASIRTCWPDRFCLRRIAPQTELELARDYLVAGLLGPG